MDTFIPLVWKPVKLQCDQTIILHVKEHCDYISEGSQKLEAKFTTCTNL